MIIIIIITIIIIIIIIIIIRTTKFLEKFISSERNAVTGINQIYSTYDNVHSVPEWRHVINELFTHS